MIANPLLGVLFHWIGGLSSASFYVPYKRIKGWNWEVFWIAGGFFSWVVAPWVFALTQSSDLFNVLQQAPTDTLFWCYLWGALWGIGGLTFGLAVRYLGMSLGMAVALGFTTVIGTMGPPVFRGTIGALLATTSGQLTLLGILITVIGIAIVGRAGQRKEAEAPAEGESGEFNLKKGILVAVFSGVMSSCFAFGLDAGGPVRELTLAAGTHTLNQGLPVLCVVLAGGFTTNLIWCAFLIFKNGSFPQLFGGQARVTDAGALESGKASVPRNLGFAALGGTLWYLQFFFYTMGESQMGEYGFSSWSLHMASIILFSTIWGFVFKEWAQASSKTRLMVWAGIATLILSTIVIGAGNFLGAH